MTKARLHPSLREFRGAMGEMVFKQRGGKLYVSMRPTKATSMPSDAQLAHRERFRLATQYGKFVMADEASRQLYQQVAAERDTSPFALCVADFLNRPSVDIIDPSDYTGKVGDPIRIAVSDDFGVVKVSVSIADADAAELIESGWAVETPAGSGHWTYMVTKAVVAGTLVQFQVTATDRPGGTGAQISTKTI